MAFLLSFLNYLLFVIFVCSRFSFSRNLRCHPGAFCRGVVNADYNEVFARRREYDEVVWWLFCYWSK